MSVIEGTGFHPFVVPVCRDGGYKFCDQFQYFLHGGDIFFWQNAEKELMIIDGFL
jgi:hypothetical protein